jgi:acetyl esterase
MTGEVEATAGTSIGPASAPPLEPAIAAWLTPPAERSAPATEPDVEEIRRSMVADHARAERLAPVPDGVGEESVVLGGRIPARVFRPYGAGPHPVIVYFHGGGWVAGGPLTHVVHARQLCADVAAIVVSVDYRLAPEHRHPAPYEDCLAACRQVMLHAERLGADPERVVVAGDSAGAQLAASVALARDVLPRPLAAQLLIVPATDLVGGYADADRNGAYPSRLERASGPGLTTPGMARNVGWYLGGADGERDPRASPLCAASVGHAPPAVVCTAGFDPLRDEGIAYARRLQEQDVRVLHRHHPTLNHGFFVLTGVSEVARRATRQAAGDLRTLLDPERSIARP